MNEKSIQEMIVDARRSVAALGSLLEYYRPYLTLIAEQHIYDQLRVRCSPADVVQQTLLEATRAFPAFRGSSEPELSMWLKRILDNNIADAIRRHFRAGKRDLDRERPLFLAEDSASVCWHEPAANETTASRRVIRAEQALRLASLLETLPDDQREVVRLKFLEGLSMKEIVERMERSRDAVVGLLRRAIAALQQRMSVESWY